ncbi:MAG: glycosyltransferase family 4 protein [archaeon]
MKIAIVYDLIYPFSIGGAEWRNFSLAKELVLRGHEVHLYGTRMWKGNNTIKIADRFFAHGIYSYSGKYGFGGKRKALEPLIYSLHLFFELLKRDYDIIDVSSFPYFPALACKAASFFSRTPVIVTWHEVWDTYWRTYNRGMIGIIGQMVEKFLAALSNKNIAVSKSTRQRLLQFRCKSVLIENWVDYKEIEKFRNDKKIYDMVSVGRHLKHKNIGMMLRICSALSVHSPKFRALIIGEGPETLNLLQMKHSLKLDNVEIISFTKNKKKLYEYISSAKIFVLASELEGFSIVSFEAMALGLPVITIDAARNGLTDYIIDGYNGFVCHKNESIIASKIELLLKDKKLLSKVSINSQDFAKGFDIKSKVELIEQEYKKLAK